ncbi:hypothetical protein M1N42_01200 [Thermodesulfovibrionales bacterium]|nr:hypothetical protein [Thermodesulfovibrionales bacterium]MCL0035356.1 hypothetical protein [Thermodesulfovibrionales bacterium]MCL0062358.1 hypothetical protein [Thermodesulfovibrionales bacterium]MCL0068345.1 hypothetical protein [Thermodesulfovibrionales bacterium]MCL0083389.1 hypothetical protein [Thermodesulfovibrionales bacterium]
MNFTRRAEWIDGRDIENWLEGERVVMARHAELEKTAESSSPKEGCAPKKKAKSRPASKKSEPTGRDKKTKTAKTKKEVVL